MNIGLVLSQVEVTGAEVYAVLLADALIKRGHGVVIISDTLTKKTLADYVKMDLNNRSYPNRIRHILSLVKLIKDKKIDVLHALKLRFVESLPRCLGTSQITRKQRPASWCP